MYFSCKFCDKNIKITSLIQIGNKVNIKKDDANNYSIVCDDCMNIEEKRKTLKNDIIMIRQVINQASNICIFDDENNDLKFLNNEELETKIKKTFFNVVCNLDICNELLNTCNSLIK